VFQIYFLFPEPNGHKLEVLDAIFHEAHEKGENPVFTEKRWRKHGWHKASEAQVGGENGMLPGVADEKDRQRSMDVGGEHIENVENERKRSAE
jgi:hypothetical protein